MNKLCHLRLCTLDDEQLMEAIDAKTDEIFQTQKVPAMHIPARPNQDYDLLVGELILRYKAYTIFKPDDPNPISDPENYGLIK